MTIKEFSKLVLREALDLLYPRRCPVCGDILMHKEHLICDRCLPHLPWIRQPRCMKCGKQLESDTREYCATCQQGHHRFVQGYSVLLYEKEIRESVNRMKFENHREYLDFYAAVMAAGARDYLNRVRPAVLIPVPMSKKRRRQRGFDQCALLAQKLSNRTGIPCIVGNLVRTRNTKPQKGLDEKGRQDNLRDAFEVLDPAAIQEPVMLIDDIYTTGATMDELCRTLERYGIKRIWFLTLCSGKGK